MVLQPIKSGPSCLVASLPTFLASALCVLREAIKCTAAQRPRLALATHAFVDVILRDMPSKSNGFADQEHKDDASAPHGMSTA